MQIHSLPPAQSQSAQAVRQKQTLVCHLLFRAKYKLRCFESILTCWSCSDKKKTARNAKGMKIPAVLRFPPSRLPCTVSPWLFVCSFSLLYNTDGLQTSAVSRHWGKKEKKSSRSVCLIQGTACSNSVKAALKKRFWLLVSYKLCERMCVEFIIIHTHTVHLFFLMMMEYFFHASFCSFTESI